MHRRTLLLAAAALFGTSAAAEAARRYPPMAPDQAASLVETWYQAYLGRSALNDPGSAGWIDALQRGTTSPEEVVAGLLGSPEFYGRAGNTMPGFVGLLFRNVVGRDPTPGEIDFWMRRAYTHDRIEIAREVLAQHPGVAVAPPSVSVVPTPAVPPRPVYGPGGWRHHEFEYRRPAYPYRW
jgi:hypothetical protein